MTPAFPLLAHSCCDVSSWQIATLRGSTAVRVSSPSCLKPRIFFSGVDPVWEFLIGEIIDRGHALETGSGHADLAHDELDWSETWRGEIVGSVLSIDRNQVGSSRTADSICG
jgi:hypothetical protein